jgi:hypothetical protein
MGELGTEQVRPAFPACSTNLAKNEKEAVWDIRWGDSVRSMECGCSLHLRTSQKREYIINARRNVGGDCTLRCRGVCATGDEAVTLPMYHPLFTIVSRWALSVLGGHACVVVWMT